MVNTGYHLLRKLENQPKSQVDNDFFQDHTNIRPLTRVINVLRAQLLDETANNNNALSTLNSMLNANQSELIDLHQNNPAYNALKKQQDIVEKTIEHLSVHLCSNLNPSVVAVGMASKTIEDAVGQVKGLMR